MCHESLLTDSEKALPPDQDPGLESVRFSGLFKMPCICHA